MSIPLSLRNALTAASSPGPKEKKSKPSVKAIAKLTKELKSHVSASRSTAWPLSIFLQGTYKTPPTSSISSLASMDARMLHALQSAANQAGFGLLELAPCRISRLDIEAGTVGDKMTSNLMFEDKTRGRVELEQVYADVDLDFVNWEAVCKSDDMLLPQTIVTKYEPDNRFRRETCLHALVVCIWRSDRREVVLAGPVGSGNKAGEARLYKKDKEKEAVLQVKVDCLEEETVVAPLDERVPCAKWKWGKMHFGDFVAKKLDDIMKGETVCGWISGFDSVTTARNLAAFIEENGPSGIISRAGGRGARSFVYIKKPEEGAERILFDSKARELQMAKDELEEVQVRIASFETKRGRGTAVDTEDPPTKKLSIEDSPLSGSKVANIAAS